MFELIADEPEFILVAKTAPASFHCEAGEPGLFEQVKAGLGLERLYPVHRLDRMTTGLLLLAKTKSAAAEFGRLFAAQQINKYYIAISDLKPKKKQGWIKGDMVKARRGGYKLLRSSANPAITQFISTSVQPGQRLFLLKPHSGKTHQLRVALKSIGAPIIGDSLYYGCDVHSGSEQADRGYLHAYALAFAWAGKHYSWVYPPQQGEWFCAPAVQQQLNLLWRQPWLLFKKKEFNKVER